MGCWTMANLVSGTSSLRMNARTFVVDSRPQVSQNPSCGKEGNKSRKSRTILIGAAQARGPMARRMLTQGNGFHRQLPLITFTTRIDLCGCHFSISPHMSICVASVARDPSTRPSEAFSEAAPTFKHARALLKCEPEAASTQESRLFSECKHLHSDIIHWPAPRRV